MARTSFVKPIVVVSQCLTQVPCRWDGERLSYPFARKLQRYARLVTVCPEVEIGLGVPREKIVLVEQKGTLSLIQPATGRKLTRRMTDFSRKHVVGLEDVDGFLLKSKSPSCGLRDTKRLDGSGRIIGRGPGLYVAETLKDYLFLAIEDERRLEDHEVREHWLTRLFVSSSFRAVKKQPSAGRLTSFHKRHASLLSAYNKTRTARLSKLVASINEKSIRAVTTEYEDTLARVLKSPARVRAIVESMASAYDYYSGYLGRSEKMRYRELVDKCLKRELPVNDLRKLIQVWAVRYDKNFIREHSLYRPYPGPLAVGG